MPIQGMTIQENAISGHQFGKEEKERGANTAPLKKNNNNGRDKQH